MNLHDDFHDSLAVVRTRPRVIRIVHADTGQVTNEIDVPDEKSLSQIDSWVSWLETTCGPDYEVERSA